MRTPECKWNPLIVTLGPTAHKVPPTSGVRTETNTAQSRRPMSHPQLSFTAHQANFSAGDSGALLPIWSVPNGRNASRTSMAMSPNPHELTYILA